MLEEQSFVLEEQSFVVDGQSFVREEQSFARMTLPRLRERERCRLGGWPGGVLAAQRVGVPSVQCTIPPPARDAGAGRVRASRRDAGAPMVSPPSRASGYHSSRLSNTISLRKAAVCLGVAGMLLFLPVTADFTKAVRFTAFTA